MTKGVKQAANIIGSLLICLNTCMVLDNILYKLEGMAVTKLAALTLLGIPAPFFIDSYYQFSVGFLPSFWVAKAMQNEAVLYFSIGLMVALVWYYFLTKRLFRKLAG